MIHPTLQQLWYLSDIHRLQIFQSIDFIWMHDSSTADATEKLILWKIYWIDPLNGKSFPPLNEEN